LAVFTERNLRDLMSGSDTLDTTQITPRRINGTIITHWPHDIPLTIGIARVFQDCSVVFDDSGDKTNHPIAGSQITAGSFTFTLWDGGTESPAYPCTIFISASLDWSINTSGFDSMSTSLDFS
jgi:hypothetical protein